MLRLDRLRKSYGSILAVDEISLEVRRGEIVGLLGPNGAGKSTTVGMIVGLVAPDAGEVRLEGGGSPRDPEMRRRIGIAPQSLALWDELTGDENVSLLGQVGGLGGNALRGAVDRALDIAGLAERRKDRAKTYSGGMKRRLNLAMALVNDPDLLLCDEPTVGVDPQSRNRILDSLRELASRGKAIVYTTHYMEEAERICDRVAIVDQGRVLAEGATADLVARHGGAATLVARTASGREVRVETSNPVGELERLGREEPIVDFSLERPNLETVFLHLTGRQLRDE